MGKNIVNYAQEGAGRYVVGEIEPFDQKNEMFKRPFWDSEVFEVGRQFYKGVVAPRKKSGYRLQDLSLINAAWHIENSCAHGVRRGRSGLYTWSWKGGFTYPNVPKGLEIDANSSERITRLVKKAALFSGASLVGICEIDRRWLYSSVFNITDKGAAIAKNDIPDHIEFAIILAFEMDYDAIKTSPSHTASAATGLGYSKMAFTVSSLAEFIRGLGYQAFPCGNDTALTVPLAIDAGLGELGRNGILITPQYGPRVRLAKVLTNLPLVPDRPVEFGVWNFCKICQLCAQKCPGKALMKGDPSTDVFDFSNRKGLLAWRVNAKKCFSFWAKNGSDCSNCIRVCPFNKPPGKLHDFVRGVIRRTRLFNKTILWADKKMGYGRYHNSNAFWHGE